LTGITEPIEFTFLFVAPVLFGVHVIFAGLSFMLMALLGVKAGMSFSGGVIDYLLYWNLSTKSWLIIPVGLGFAVIYYFGFRFAIRKWDLATPGREKEAMDNNKEQKIEVDERTKAVIEALGGLNNIEDVDCCITRLRLEVVDDTKIKDKQLKQLGASGVMKVKGGGVQVVFGTESNELKDKIDRVL
jgi:PTS system D-glucosamine-specific IIC component